MRRRSSTNALSRRALSWCIALLLVSGAAAWSQHDDGAPTINVATGSSAARPAARPAASPAASSTLVPTTVTPSPDAGSGTMAPAAPPPPPRISPTTPATVRLEAPAPAPAPTPTTARPRTTPPAFAVTPTCRGVYVLDLATGRATAVSGAPRAAFGPRYAPDGSSLTWAESQSRVLFTRSDSTVRVASTVGANNTPMWTPDNRHVIWSRSTNGSGFEAVITDVETGTETTVANTVRMRSLFAASPTGEHVAYGGGEQPGLRVARVDGTSDVQVPGAPEIRNPVWTPDGTTLTYDDGAGVSAYDLASGTTRKLYAGPIDGGFTFAGADRLLVATGSTGIRVVDVATGATVHTIDGGGEPVWDAARQRVLFRRPANQPYGQILEAALDGSNERVLFVERDAQVLGFHPSPLGDRVAFHCQIVNSA